MGLFDHHHHWLPKTGLNSINDSATRRTKGGLIIEACTGCDAVRQIEFAPEHDPVVRYGKTPS